MSITISLDTETNGLHFFHGAQTFMVCALDEEGAYRTWEWPVDPKSRQVQYDLRVDDLRHYLCGNELVFHHADFDLRALNRMGIRVSDETFEGERGPGGNWCVVKKIHDTQLLSHVVNSQGTGDSSSEFGRHALKPLALHYLDIPEGDESALQKATIAARRIGKKLGWSLGKGLDGDSQVKADYWMPKACWYQCKMDSNIQDGPVDFIVPEEWAKLCETYCKGDVYRTLGLFFFLQEILHKEGLQKHYENELRLLPVTHLMEHFGLHCDRKGATKLLSSLEEDLESYKSEADTLLGGINCNSSPQIAKALSDRGIPIAERTPKGSPKTDAKTLRSLASYCESTSLTGEQRPKAIRDAGHALRLIVGYHPDNGDMDEEETPVPGYKTFKTGVGYVTSYLGMLDSLSCLHPSYNQVGTAWTRYASREPNGQNISAKAILPLRRLFGPPPGYVWFDIDYQQKELRIFAYASGDTKMIQAFEDGINFHLMTASEIYSLPPEKINKEQKTIAKNCSFGVIFGAGPKKIDQTTGRPGTAKLYMDKFPGAKRYMNRVMAQVERYGYVEALDGRRLYVPQEKPYAAVNAIVQGTAGIIMKSAMVTIHERQLVDWEPPTKELHYGGSSIVANVHDSLVLQIPLCYPYESIARSIMKVMEDAGTALKVKTPVEAALIKSNWAEGEKFV